MTTDGLEDQNGGEENSSFGRKNVKNLLENIYEENLDMQEEKIIKTLEEYMSGAEQRDDITIIGFKFS